MLERVTRSLESGGRRLLRAGRLRKRALHPAFWIHGGGELALAAVAADILHSAGKDDIISSIEHAVQTTRTKVDPVQLEFLYPAQTLAYLRRALSTTSTRCVDRSIWPRSTFVRERRLYSSSAGPWRRRMPSVEETIAALQLPFLESPGPRPSDARFPDLEAFIQSNIPGRRDLAWYYYCQEQQKAGCHASKYKGWVVSYLLQSSYRTDQQRVLSIITSLKPSERVQNDYLKIVECLLRLDLAEFALPFLCENVDMGKSAKDTGFEELMAHYIRLNRWDMVEEAYVILFSRQRRMELDTMRLSTLVPDFHNTVVRWVRRLPPSLGFVKRDLSKDLIIGWFRQVTDPSRADDGTWEELLLLGQDKGWKFTTPEMQRLLLYLHLRGNHEKVSEVYREFREQNPKNVSGKMLNSVINSYRRLRDFKGMQLVFDDFFKLSRAGNPDRRAYRSIMAELAKFGESEMVERVLEQFEHRFPISELEICMLMHSYAKRGEPSEVVRCFDRIGELGLKYDVVCFNILINALSKALDVDGAMSRFNDMVALGLKPDEKTLRPLMELSSSRGDVETTESIFNLAKESGCQMNWFLYEALASAYVEVRDMEKAMETLSLAYNDVDPVEMCPLYNTILAGYASLNQPDKMNNLFKEMLQHNIPFDPHTYGTLMHSFCLSEKIQAAEDIIPIMRKEGIPVGAAHYHILMVAYTRRLDLEKTLDTFKNMIADDIPASFTTVAILLQAYAFTEQSEYRKRSHGELDLGSAETLLEQVIAEIDVLDLSSFEANKSGTPPWLFTPLVSVYGKDGSWERAVELFDRFMEIRQQQRPGGVDPDPKMYQAMMNAYRVAGYIEAVWSMYSALKSSARRLFKPAILDAKEYSKVLSKHKYSLCSAFSILIRSLAQDGNLLAVSAEAMLLKAEGYELDNVNYNDWVQALAVANQTIDAMRMCEERLMTDPAAVSKLYEHYQQRSRRNTREKGLRLPKFYPFVRTAETLATELKSIDERRMRGDRRAKFLLEEIKEYFPRTWEICDTLQNLETRVNREMTYRLRRANRTEGLPRGNDTKTADVGVEHDRGGNAVLEEEEEEEERPFGVEHYKPRKWTPVGASVKENSAYKKHSEPSVWPPGLPPISGTLSSTAGNNKR